MSPGRKYGSLLHKWKPSGRAFDSIKCRYQQRCDFAWSVSPMTLINLEKQSKSPNIIDRDRSNLVKYQVSGQIFTTPLVATSYLLNITTTVRMNKLILVWALVNKFSYFKYNLEGLPPPHQQSKRNGSGWVYLGFRQQTSPFKRAWQSYKPLSTLIIQPNFSLIFIVLHSRRKPITDQLFFRKRATTRA